MKTKKKIKKKKLIICLLVIALVFSGVFTIFVQAIWNPDEAVKIKVNDIENSTLIVGTHLIHLSSLTNELYEIAQNTAIESEQENVYYKSELANGAWFDITNASSLKDITTSGTPVADSVIEALLFTHHTKSDGITYDLRTSKPVNIYDIKNPYDIKTLEEMFPLKTQFDLMNETPEGSDSSKSKIKRVRQILEMEVKNDATKKCDDNLKAMQIYYDVLSKNNAPTENMDVVQGVMSAEDASRRAEVFTKLEATLNTYSEELQKDTDNTDTSLQSAVNDSLSNVSSSLIKYQGEMLDVGTTVMTETQYEYSQKLIQDSNVNNHASCDTDVASLLALTRIVNGVVLDKEAESSFLEKTLLPKATEKYTSGLKSGQNEEYQVAVQNNSASVVLNQIIESNTSTLNICRNELESYITAEVIRLDILKAKSFVSERLNNTADYYTIIKQDSFLEKSKSTVDQHVDFLSQKLKEIEQGGTGNETDKLMSQKEDLKTKYLEALDNNNLNDAKKFKDQISSLESKIKSKQSEWTGALSKEQQTMKQLQDQLDKANNGENTGTSTNELESKIAKSQLQIASIKANLSSNSVGELVSTMKKECIDIISKGNPDSSEMKTLKTSTDTLQKMQDLNYQIVFPALQDIHLEMTSQRDLNGSNSFKGLISDLDKNILENKSSYEQSLHPELSSDKIDSVADEFFNGGDSTLINSPDSKKNSVSELNDKQKQAVYIQALQMYCDKTDSTVAKGKLASLAQKQLNLGNPLVFNRINEVSMEYLPATAVAGYANMRYVWNKNMNQGTLARGGTYYVFTAYSDVVQKGKGNRETEKMSKATKFLATLYIPADYAKKTFNVDVVYLTGTTYGVLSSEKLNKYAEQMQSMLLES